MAYDARRRRAVLFGGHDFGAHAGVSVFGDTWEWDGNEWSRSQIGSVEEGVDDGH